MDWIDGQRLGIGQLSRRQNLATIYVAGFGSSGSVTPVYKDEDEAWVDLPESEGAARPGESFLWIRERKAFLWLSEHDGWRRAWAVPFDGSTSPAPVTPAGMDVIEIGGADPESRRLYYIASPDNATERYLYRSPIDHAGPPERISPVSHPGTHRYQLSPDCRWAFHTYSAFDIPPAVDLVNLSGHQSVRVLEEHMPASPR
jgi:dipeptidyl-peptidase-4